MSMTDNVTKDKHPDRDQRSAVDKAFSVLRAFGDDAYLGLGVSELARRAGLSKSTTFRLLGSLERNRAVVRVGTAYRLGALVDKLEDSKTPPMHNVVRDILTPFLADLYEATRSTVQLAVLRGSFVVYLNKLEGHQRLRTPSRIGGQMPAYCTAIGKVMLAADAHATEAVLQLPRHPWTRHTITDEHAVLAQLNHVRESGLAYDNGESLDTLTCVAAPVRGANGQVVAALSVSGHSASFRAARFESDLRSVAYSASRAIVVHGSRREQSAPHPPAA